MACWRSNTYVLRYHRIFLRRSITWKSHVERVCCLTPSRGCVVKILQDLNIRVKKALAIKNFVHELLSYCYYCWNDVCQ